jgi:hypothetical protein
MGKCWQGEVHIDAPVSEVYRFLADFSRHNEWDSSVTRLELVEKGDANGIGDHWRAYEKLDTLQSDRGRKPLLQLHGNVGVAVREVRELVPNKRVAWHTYPVPRMGITADCSFDLEEENGGTKLTETVQINALSVLESFGKFVFKSLDAKQTAQWEQNLQAVRQAVEAATPAAAVAGS